LVLSFISVQVFVLWNKTRFRKGTTAESKKLAVFSRDFTANKNQNMVNIKTNILGDNIVDKNSILHGMISGNVIVKDSVDFIVFGKIVGSILIEKNGKTKIHGTVQGNKINSGECQIFGVVKGFIEKVGGQFLIDPKAIVQT